MKILGTGRELARLPIDGKRRVIRAGHPALIPLTEIKCSKSVISTQGAQLNVGLATLSRIPLQIRRYDSFSMLERQVDSLSLLFRRNKEMRAF